MIAGNWIDVCGIDDIARLGSRCVRRPTGMAVALFRNAEDQVFALLDRCPHRGGPLSQGIVHGNHVTCPLHNWQIGLADGVAHEPDSGQALAFACRVVDGRVQLDAVELAGKGIELEAPVAGPACRITVD